MIRMLSYLRGPHELDAESIDSLGRLPEKAALYHLFQESQKRAGKARISKSPGTHRGHNKVFLAAPRTPSSASVFL